MSDKVDEQREPPGIIKEELLLLDDGPTVEPPTLETSNGVPPPPPLRMYVHILQMHGGNASLGRPAPGAHPCYREPVRLQ